MARQRHNQELHDIHAHPDTGVRARVPTDRQVGLPFACSPARLPHSSNPRIRPLYVFEKTVATFGTFALLYTVTEGFIIPQLPTPGTPVWRSILDLAMPFMGALLLLFYIIFGA